MVVFVTNSSITNRNLLHVIEEAIAAKVDMIIIREKNITHKERAEILKEAMKLANNSNTLISINSDEKLKDFADAYHMTYDAFKSFDLKDYKGKTGVSVHSLNEAIDVDGKADYMLVGHIFKTDCKKDLQPRGLNFLKEICEKVKKTKVIAIGGIKTQNFHLALNAGADGIAVMSLIMEADNIEKTISSLRVYS